MKFKRLISLVLVALMIASLSTVCLSANAAEVENASTGAGLGLGNYYNASYLEDKIYNGTDLGSTYTPSKTTWKVWSPEAIKVKLNLYATGSDLENGAENLGSYDMKLDKSTGVWSVALDGDFKNVYYTYIVATKSGTNETYDIYAKACGVNGNRSMVVDLDATDPEGWEKDEHVFLDQQTDEGIWEVHIADLTSSDTSGVSDEYRGKYLGFIEGGLTVNGKDGGSSVGVDYLVEQGIKAVHIQCPFDFASGDERNDASYNWGYDPKNYNVPEGLYSTNPYDGNVRITEFKQLVQALHDRGISVIMGVVYNHTFGTEQSAFTYTVPGYYYRMSSSTFYINCTACGNTLATDKQMFRNYMKQSLKYWVEEYHIDGFRFDLMAAHDYQIMNEIREMFNGMYGGEGKKIIMYGEPWTGTGGDPGIYASNAASLGNISKLSANIGCFNDTIREAIKKWFAGDSSTSGTVKDGITSSNKAGVIPNKSINYYDCHDGATWWDTLAGTGNFNSTNATLRSKLRTSMTYLFTSQAMPFMLAGTEFARTKNGKANTYNDGEENAFDWDRIDTYATEVAYVKGLREIRNAFSPFRSSNTPVTPSYISTSSNIIAYSLNNSKSGEWSKAVVIVNNGGAGTVNLPSGNWTIVSNGEKAGLASLGTASGSYKVPANGSAILVQGETKATSATYETVTVKHVVDGKAIKTTESLYAVGDTWRAVPDNYTIFNHEVVSVESNVGTKLGNTYYGTVKAGEDVVVTITYEKIKDDGYLTVKYVDQKGATVSSDIKFRMLNGESFNIPFANVSGYELDSSEYPDNFKGTFDASNPETITFVYKQLKTDGITVYYYNTTFGGTVGMYAYTAEEDKPLGAWGAKAQRMSKVSNASELPPGESVGNWYKHSITKENNQLDYDVSSCYVMFHNMNNGMQEPLNGEAGYIASGTIYVKNKIITFNADVVTSHIDADTGERLAEDERVSYNNKTSKEIYTTKPKTNLGTVITPTNATGSLVAGSTCVVYLYDRTPDDITEPTTVAPPTAPATKPSETAPTTKPSEPTTKPSAPTTASVPTTTEPTSTTVTVPTTATTAPTSTPVPTTTETTPKTTVTNPGEWIEPLYLGDADLSGIVNIKDATTIQKHIAYMLMLIGDGLTCADATEDGKINIKDATVIQKHLAKLEISNPVGEPIPGTGIFVTYPVPTTVTPATTVTTAATTVATDPTEVTTPPVTTVAPTTVATDPTEVSTPPATTAKPTETTPVKTDPVETTTVEPTTQAPTTTAPSGNIKELLSDLYIKASSLLTDSGDYIEETPLAANSDELALKANYGFDISAEDTTLNEYNKFSAVLSNVNFYVLYGGTDEELEDALEQLTNAYEWFNEYVTNIHPEPVTSGGPASGMTVYFSNNKWWSNVYVYCWDANDNNNSWPGQPMTFSHKNDYQEEVYSFDVPAGMTHILFTDGNSKSTDIELSTLTSNAFYLLDTQNFEGAYDYGTWNYPG